MGSFYHYPLDGQHFYMSSTKLKIGSRRPNAARERSRIKNLRDAFQLLQSALPAVPPSTKLSKLDVLLMASAYIAYLGRLVEDKEFITSEHHLTFHPVKKWPMRARLYAGLNYSGSSRSFDPQNSHHRFAADNNEYS